MSFDYSTPLRAYLNGRNPVDLLTADVASSPSLGIIHLCLPGTPPTAVGPNSHIKRKAKWSGEDSVRQFARAGMRPQPITIFRPGSTTYAIARIAWEKGRRVRDPDNADHSLKLAYDQLQYCNYIANDRDLETKTIQTSSGQRQGDTDLLVLGELNPDLPETHVCRVLPVGTGFFDDEEDTDAPHAVIYAHRPEDTDDLMLCRPDGSLMTDRSALFK